MFVTEYQVSRARSQLRGLVEILRSQLPFLWRPIRFIYGLSFRTVDLIPHKTAKYFPDLNTIYVDISSTVHFKHMDGIRRINIEVFKY